MRFVHDPLKDISNIRKHGVSLRQAEELDWESALVWLDDRTDYGEDRAVALGSIGNLLYFLAFVEKDEEIRVISMRRATNREIRRYVDQI